LGIDDRNSTVTVGGAGMKSGDCGFWGGGGVAGGIGRCDCDVVATDRQIGNGIRPVDAV
jgi:hypothetical protein